jgi:hypothetical protein
MLLLSPSPKISLRAFVDAIALLTVAYPCWKNAYQHSLFVSHSKDGHSVCSVYMLELVA